MRWPTWDQALIVAMLSGLVALGVRRLRPTRATEIVGPAAMEFAFVASLYSIWRMAKNLPLTQADGAVERARDIVRVQELLHFPSELSLQRFVLDHGAVEVRYDLAFGGAFYAYVDARSAGVELAPASYRSIVDRGIRIKGAVSGVSGMWSETYWQVS